MKNYITALGIAVTTALPHAAHAQGVTPPSVPASIQVDQPSEAFLLGHGVGTQNYVCQPSTPLGRVAWTLFTPQATLFSDLGEQLTTHFFSPNPDEGRIVRVTWEDSRDTSIVWARAIASVVGLAGRDSLAQATDGRNSSGTDRRRHVNPDDVHPTGEYRRRRGTPDGMRQAARRRPQSVRAVHGRLLLLQELAAPETLRRA